MNLREKTFIQNDLTPKISRPLVSEADDWAAKEQALLSFACYLLGQRRISSCQDFLRGQFIPRWACHFWHVAVAESFSRVDDESHFVNKLFVAGDRRLAKASIDRSVDVHEVAAEDGRLVQLLKILPKLRLRFVQQQLAPAIEVDRVGQDLNRREDEDDD